MSTPAVVAVRQARELARHPPGLKVIFFTEMWERFSYYGMRALLVLYLVNALEYPRAEALRLYGIYTGLVYLTPLAGGYLADRYLGVRQGAVIGAIVMTLGHFAMAFPALLHVALGLLVVGNGFFKPSTSAMVGMLYGERDPRRDGGYTIFYMGINLGAFLSPLVAGTLGERVGWHWGFASAGVGMAIGLFTLLRWQGLLADAGLRSGKARIDGQAWGRVAGATVASVVFVALVVELWGPVAAMLAALPFSGKLLLALLVVGCAFAWPALRGRRHAGPSPLSPSERDAIIVICVVAFFVVFFWMGFEQAGGTMNLFADRLTDRRIFGREIPATWFQSINPLLIVLLAPAFALAWARLDASRHALSGPAKQAFGMITLGLGFVVLAVAQDRAEALGIVGPQWLVAVYVLHTIGELMLSPVGLAMVSKLAPARLGGLLMGVWLFSSAAANYLAGALESLLEGSGIPLYWFLVGASIGAGLLLLAISPWLNSLSRGRA